MYEALLATGFIEEARLKEHCQIDGKYFDVLLHAHFNPRHYLKYRHASDEDAKLFFEWANDPEVRKNAFSTDAIIWDSHEKWFYNKLASQNSKLYIFTDKADNPVGQVRLDYDKGEWLIDYSVDRSYRGLGLGRIFIERLMESLIEMKLVALVKIDNIPSLQVFRKLGFTELREKDSIVKFIFQS
ncbi:MAG: GNAT family N-acetyltransferase [Owenweeksia sp.]|nr:GNAT family N-acetyltransferase [Owenweeksia sp.]